MPLITAARSGLRRWMIAGGVASAALLCTASLAADEARDLLQGMAGALQKQSYQGDFIYERTGSFSTHRVWRQADGDVVERLLRTDGPPQEWIRRNGRLECTSSLVAGGAHRDSGMLLEPSPSLDKWYSLDVLGNSRVANRAVTVIAIQPRDSYRYAFEFYLDVESGLLLQSLMINDQGALLERFQFTNLELGAVAQEHLEAASLCRTLSTEPAPEPEPEADNRWLPSWMPPGFAPVRSESHPLGGDDNPIHTQVFTDGLARFTVFIEPLVQERETNDLRAQLGPTVVVSRRLEMPEGSYLATVVGEVPPRAAERIARSLSPDYDPEAVIETTP